MIKLTEKQKEAFGSLNNCAVNDYERPEAFQLSVAGKQGLTVKVKNKTFLGFYCEYDVSCLDGEIKVISLDPSLEIGCEATLTKSVH